ncbi:MAG TPA: hypothetical protein VG939_06775 [Caulobacteraceae bacterium]|nr:hypothetical protein [Caulobacteraceae bacterium]
MAELALSFRRLGPDRHAFSYRRPDGTGETVEMETHSLLRHDLIHFAVETEAHLRGSFFGILAKVGGYEELRVNGGQALGGEVAITERVVGAITGALGREDLDDEAFVAEAGEFLELFDEGRPRWFTPDFVRRVRERMRDLDGRWKATPFGEALELSFPLP